MQDTRPLLLETDFPPVRRGELSTLQVNLGYICNLSCVSSKWRIERNYYWFI